MESREYFICDYADIVRESETLTRQQYTRTIYAATLGKEVLKLSLRAVESVLCIIHNSLPEQASAREGAGECDKMVDNLQSKASACTELFWKVRYLHHDVDDLERVTRTLENVRCLDETLPVSNDEFKGLQTYLCTVSDTRKHVESCVGKAIPYDS